MDTSSSGGLSGELRSSLRQDATEDLGRRGLSLDYGAEARLQSLIEEGVQRLEVRPSGATRIELARGNLSRLVEAMAQEASVRETNQVDDAVFNSAYEALFCDIFPYCSRDPEE